jgi:hypothetical protein
VSQGFDAGTLLCVTDCSGYDTGGCFDIPVAWRCDPALYWAGDGCHCGCGAVDPDCASSAATVCDSCDDVGSCGVAACPANIDPNANHTCTVPAQWTCNDTYYAANDGCDCGCGALDPDCETLNADVCDWCNDAGSCDDTGQGCPGLIDPDDNTQCAAAVCGNGFIEAGEVCEPGDLDGETCVGLGFFGGTLACGNDCTAFDTSGCFNLPAAWRCDPALYGAGDGCHCGCGAQDLDCADSTVNSCAVCDVEGSCAVGSCPSNIAPAQNHTCTVPAQWTCDPNYYGADDGCDCGCGALDPDCSDVTAAVCDYCNNSGSCDLTGNGCPGIIDPAQNSACTAPPEWRCAADDYDDGSWCHCGCGALDPDCSDASVNACDFCAASGSCGTGPCPANIAPAANYTCTVPAEWNCDASHYGTNDGCHCGCGAVDPDCGAVTADVCDECNAGGSCDTTGSGCPGLIDPEQNDICANWRCPANYYNDGFLCDCGCGVLDPDCPSPQAADCDFCDSTGSCAVGSCPSNIAPDENYTCTVPAQWTCAEWYYGVADGCDCGCGALDPDCEDVTADVCDYCNDNGSCGTGACPANIDPNDNSTCI